jgi:hypothetical protein
MWGILLGFLLIMAPCFAAQGFMAVGVEFKLYILGKNGRVAGNKWQIPPPAQMHMRITII